VQTITT